MHQFGLIIAIIIQLCSTAQINKLEYDIKTFQTLEERSQYAILTAYLDEDPFHEWSGCGKSTKDPSSFVSCCTTSANAECHSPLVSNKCVDLETELDQVWNLDQGESQNFEFQIKNTNSCLSFAILVKALSGDPDLAVSFSASNPQPTIQKADLVSQRAGSDSLLACCETSYIVDQSPPWDGRIFFSVIAYTKTSFRVTIKDRVDLLSATDLFYVPQLRVECNGISMVSEPCEYCTSVPPTSDPLFSHFAQLTGLFIPIEYQPRQISIVLQTMTVQFTSVNTSSTRFAFDASVLARSDCIYSFPNIISYSGEAFSGSSSINRKTLTCSHEDFSRTIEGIDDVLNQLTKLSTADVTIVRQYLYRATIYTISDWWTGCVSMIENQLMTVTQSTQIVSNTLSCFAIDPNSDEYLDDPCCNPLIQDTQCCAARTVFALAPTFEVNSSAVDTYCRYPSCSTQLLNDYKALADPFFIKESACVRDTIQALSDPLFRQNPLTNCLSLIYQRICSENDNCVSINNPNTVCLGVGYCTMPCLNDGDCVTGTCQTIQGSRTCLLYDLYEANETVSAISNLLLIECLNNNTNEYLGLFIRQELGLNSSSTNEEYKTLLFNAIVKPDCQSTSLTPSADMRTNQTLCEQPQLCNWAACNNFDDANCTQENCLDPLLNHGDFFCQACFGVDDCFEISSFEVCQYHLFGTPSDCSNMYSGHWNPISGGCYRVTDCFPSQFCTVTESLQGYCPAFCYDPSKSQANCESLNFDWVVTSFGGVCRSTNLTAGDCNSDLLWWPGTFATPSILSSRTTCEAYGYCWPSGEQTTEENCLNRYFCEGCPDCLDEQACLSAGRCSTEFYSGCIIPYLPSGDCAITDDWTPYGCHNLWVNISACTALGGFKFSHKNETECLSYGIVCTEPKLAGSFLDHNTVHNQQPNGVSFKSDEECQLCGGELKSFFRWVKPRWIAQQWTPQKWIPRNFTRANQWVKIANSEIFEGYYNRSLVRRYASTIASNIICRFNQRRSLMGYIACNCGIDSVNSPCDVPRTLRSIVQAELVCNNVPTFSEFGAGTLYASKQVEVQNEDCTNVIISLVPITQYERRRQVSLSIGAIVLSQSGRAGQVLFVKNSNNITIGQVIASGIQFSSSQRLSGVTTCFRMPQNVTTSLPVSQFDLAQLIEENGLLNFKPIGLNIPIDQQEVCIDMLDDVTLFPAVMMQNWELATFIGSLYPVEVFLIYFGVAVYTAACSLWTFQLIAFLRQHLATGYFQLPTVSLYLLGLALLDRLLFLFLLPVGVFEASVTVTTVFAELPALLYYTIFSLIMLSWAKVYCFTVNSMKAYHRLKIVTIAMNVFIGLAFIALLIAFSVIGNQVSVLTCEDPTGQLSPQEILGIIYKIIFAVFCLVLSILFSYYGTLIVQLSNSLQSLALNEIDQQDIQKTRLDLIKKIVITVVGALCLLGQAANLIRAAFEDSSIYVLLFIYIVEIAPAVLFLLVLKKANYQAPKKAAPRASRTRYYKAIPAFSNYDPNKSNYSKQKLLNDEDLPMSPVIQSNINDLPEIAYSEILVERTLGEGNFGTVSLGNWQGRPVALKRCKVHTTEFMQEAQLLISIPLHENVVRALGISHNGTVIILVMEYCELGLDFILFDSPDILPEGDKLSLMIGAARGVAHLHKNHIIHRDLAARNVLLSQQTPKISDFGLSKVVENISEEFRTKDTAGPIRWMSPEALRGVYSAKTDVWTFGIVMYEILTQSEPHVEEDTLFVGLKIRDQGFTPKIPRDCPAELANLMRECWNIDPSLRPDMNTVYTRLSTLLK